MSPSNSGPSVPVSTLTGLQDLLKGASQGAAPLLSQQSSFTLAGGASPLVVVGAQGHDITHAGQVSEALQIWLLVDKSGSMSGDVADVVAGQNKFLHDLNRDPRRGEMLLAQWESGDTNSVVHPAVPLSQAKMLCTGCPGPNQHLYNADGRSTRLLESWQDVIAAAVAHHKFNEEDSPCPVPTTSLVIVLTDGEENHITVGSAAYKRKCQELQKIAEDLLKSERFILAFIGVDRNFRKGADPKTSRFWQIAKDMGIPDGCIGVDSDVARAFIRISSSTSGVSQGKVRAGGASTFFTS